MNPQQYTGGNGWKWPVRAGILALLFALCCLLSIRQLERRQIKTIPRL